MKEFRGRFCQPAAGLPANLPALSDSVLTSSELIEMIESQLLSRLLDLEARRLQAQGDAYYTIGSAGHEGHAALGKAFRVTDPAFLHYRDAALLIQRSKALPGQTITWDMLLSFMASTEDPIAGGRHKVLGSKALTIPPQTSTIASHLPKAVGAAYSLGLWRRLGRAGEWPNDSVVLCSFGDASLNHSTTQGAINAAGWTAYQGAPLPLVLVCADNGIGISTPTPLGWVAASMQHRPGLHYMAANGLDLVSSYIAAREAERRARTHQQPVFLHLSTVRLYGHAGSDAQQAYLSPAKIQAMEQQDPLLISAARLQHEAGFSSTDLTHFFDAMLARVQAVSEQARQRPRLTSADQVMASIVPPKRPTLAPHPDKAVAVSQTAQPMGKLLNQCLDRLMQRYPQMVVAGEDVGRKGGVYGVTQRLQQKYGRFRVIDTLLDEQSILGLAIGLGQNRMLPVVEIQFLAYLHNAEDQLRGEAATLSFFSSGQYTNPMVVRIAGLGYQKGFGGHFHNDNAIAVLRDIPGLILACPSDGRRAVGLLQEAIRLADEEQRVVVFLEPIARYHCRDLHETDDQLWCHPDPGQDFRIGHRHFLQDGDGDDLAIITYGNGTYLSQQALPALADAGIGTRLIDLCWLTDIDHEALHQAIAACKQVLIVDECRRHGSVSEELMAELSQRGRSGADMHRLTAEDSFIALGKAATCTLPDKDAIERRALSLFTARDPA
ncbi:MAG: thiamine pyrophosphate-dependent enzyme [Saccharospirillum sp.]